MTSAVPDARHVHFVGSIALDSVTEVFSTCGRALGDRLRRIPDGEPGGRRLWISWQYPLLRASPYLAPDQEAPLGGDLRPLRLADGVEPDETGFGELGYAREARASSEDFCAARAVRDLPTDVRFQVSLPTPAAVVIPFCAVGRLRRAAGLRAGDAV